MTDRDAPPATRRALLLAGAGLALAGPALAEEARTPLADVPMVSPRTEFVYEAVVEIAPLVSLGDSPLGERRIVPITGGRFQGPRLGGTVLPGGADRQLVRKDGVRRLDALYEMRTDDGVILTVRNQVLIDPGRDGAPDYRFSTIDVTAPEGPHAWLNRLVLVGTLASLRPSRDAVLVRAFRLA
ncbi:DUF3237 domain-containing protein [Methylobacterium terrae]|uniref:UPF0311 protein DK419_06380 n=1 Tax=Methylobacterium terrae TaxID=2202827 RepID=A0A2U8WIC4_9HYPH|nr:DUF3237 domain-containing protein [Methylobacterium terrae]AWN45984.1 DUF3237 domain-containing protein [Methylobacterium terrae]